MQFMVEPDASLIGNMPVGKVGRWLRCHLAPEAKRTEAHGSLADGGAHVANAKAHALQLPPGLISAVPALDSLDDLPCIYDDYEVLEVLGKGASSTVHRVRSKATEQEYAAKNIRVDTPARLASAREEFSMQRRLSASAHHGTLTTALSAYHGGPGSYYLIFDLMEGGTLADILKPGGLSESDVRMVMANLLKALATLHHHRIIHCDLKLENLMLQSSGDFTTVRLTDFGLCHDMSKQPWATQAAGTLPYFAPELVRVFNRVPDSVYGQQVDLWAAGVVMYELISGVKPFDAQSMKPLLRQISEQPVEMSGPAWDSVSEAAKDFLRKCLTRDFHKRISAKEALRHPWIRDHLKASPDRESHHPAKVGPAGVFKHLLHRKSAKAAAA